METATLKKAGRKFNPAKELRPGQSFFLLESVWKKLDDLRELENRNRTNMVETLILRAHREHFGNAQEA